MKHVRKKLVPATVLPDMNVTPLVDVVLVLLIIFMVVAPRMDQDIPVELPGIFHPDPDAKGAVDPLKVTVAKPGEYYLEQTKYDLDGIVEHLAQERAVDPLRRVVLRADAKLTYGEVRPVFTRLQELGFPGMSLQVGERHTPGAGGTTSEEPASAKSETL